MSKRAGNFFGFNCLLVLFSCLACMPVHAAPASRCLYVSSYHAGYEWNDAIEAAMAPILREACEVRAFYMDGKRNRDPEFAKQKALEAKAIIDSWHPDVVIAADDNASKYLVMPYYKDATLPVVFCGINWTVDAYGYPYVNTTGMVEVDPLEPLVGEVMRTVKDARRGVFLSADEITQCKEAERHGRVYAKHGVTLTHLPVTTMAAWEKGFVGAQQQYDFIVIGNNAGINDWDQARALAVVQAHVKKFTVTYLEWMAPVSMLTMAKIAGEQGEWAAQAAVMILHGAKPNSIPIIANRRWNMYVNPALLNKGGFALSPELLRQAVKVGS